MIFLKSQGLKPSLNLITDLVYIGQQASPSDTSCLLKLTAFCKKTKTKQLSAIPIGLPDRTHQKESRTYTVNILYTSQYFFHSKEKENSYYSHCQLAEALSQWANKGKNMAQGRTAT